MSLLKRHKYVGTIQSNDEGVYRYDVYWIYFLPSSIEAEALHGHEKTTKRLYTVDNQDNGQGGYVGNEVYLRKMRETDGEARSVPFKLTDSFLRERNVEIEHRYRNIMIRHTSVLSAFVSRVFCLYCLRYYYRVAAEFLYGYYVRPTEDRIKIINAMLLMSDGGKSVVSEFDLVHVLHGRSSISIKPSKFVKLYRRYSVVLEYLEQDGCLKSTGDGRYKISGKAFGVLSDLKREYGLYKTQRWIAIFTAILALQTLSNIPWGNVLRFFGIK